MSDPVVRSIRASELEKAAELVADAFAGDDRNRHHIIREFILYLARRPATKMEHFRAAFLGRQMVSFALVDEYMLHYGRAKLLVAGITSVCTHPNHRRQGYAGAVLRDILTYSAEQGMHMALLHGIPNYYDPFGFMPVWAVYTLEVPVAEARNLSQPLTLREAVLDDVPQLAQLYNHHWGSRVTFSRSMALWRWRLGFFTNQIMVVVDSTGQIQGYIWYRNNEKPGRRTEVVADTPQAIQSLLAYDGRRCHHAGHEKVVWSVPPDDYIIPFAQQMLPLTLSAHYSPTGHWMDRLIDSAALINALLPEINAQASAMSLDFDPRDLVLEVDSDRVKIALKYQPKSTCYLSLRDFVQVLFGSLRPEMLAIRQHLSYESIVLLQTLFPPRIAALAPWDWF
jgi:predicted N-acetyltransferase YhbS